MADSNDISSEYPSGDIPSLELPERALNIPGNEDFVPDSLKSYLRQINAIPQLSVERQTELGREIVEAVRDLRKVLYRFPFVLKEHIRILQQFFQSDSREQDFLMPSVASVRMPDAQVLRKSLRSWLKEMERLYSEFEAAASASEEWQERSVALLLQYPVINDLLEEWQDVLEGLCIFMSDEATNPAAREQYVEERIGMPSSKLKEIHDQLSSRRKRIKMTRQAMLEGNLRLVIGVACRSKHHSMPVNDLIQEGNLGLLHALEKFDFELGHRFSTYAIWWIKQNISRAIAAQSRIIRMPAHMISTISAMNNAEQKFILEHGREPEIEELAAILELPVARVSAIRKMARQTISLQAPFDDSHDGYSLEDMLEDENTLSPDVMIGNKVLQQQLKRLLGTLSEREQQILTLRFGLFGQQPQTLMRVSEHFGLTRERIRQLEIRTLKKLRDPERLKLLDNEYPKK